jgi:hypothetical protein
MDSYTQFDGGSYSKICRAGELRAPIVTVSCVELQLAPAEPPVFSEEITHIEP